MAPENGSEQTEQNGGTMGVVFTGARPGEKLHEQLAFDAEAMRPTRHPDINIWMLQQPEDEAVGAMLAQLSPAFRCPDPIILAETVRRLVPKMQQPIAA